MPIDRCHIRGRGSGGSDGEHNVILMCRFHHQEQHSIGFPRMMDKYPDLRRELKRLGWEVTEVFGTRKMFHAKEAK
jgi:hypothetical protein